MLIFLEINTVLVSRLKKINKQTKEKKEKTMVIKSKETMRQ